MWGFLWQFLCSVEHGRFIDATNKPRIEKDAGSDANIVRKIQCRPIGKSSAVFANVSFLGAETAQAETSTKMEVGTQGTGREETAMKQR